MMKQRNQQKTTRQSSKKLQTILKKKVKANIYLNFLKMFRNNIKMHKQKLKNCQQLSRKIIKKV